MRCGGGWAVRHRCSAQRVCSHLADEWVGFGSLALLLHGFQMHAYEIADNFEMAKLFGSDVDEKVAASEVVDAAPALDGVLHGSGEFAVGSAELFKKHVAEGTSGVPTLTVYMSFLMWWYIPSLQSR